MHVGEAVLFAREIECINVWWNGELEATLGWGDDGNAEPDDIELPRTRPPLR